MSFKRKVIIVCGVVFALLLAACTIGLGESVDTVAPTVEILYPPKGAVVMDTFTLAGKTTDDQGVNFVSITLTHKTLKNADGEKLTFVYTSEKEQVQIDENGKWTASICSKTENPLYKGWELADGEYFIDVEVKDASGKQGFDRRSVIIDNTAPVFIVENLSSLGKETNSDNLSTFGHKILLTGKAKDDAEIQKVYIRAFGNDKTELGKTEINYEMTADGLLIAQYSETMPEDAKKQVLAKNYNLIYGIQEGEPLGTEIRERYISIQLSDSARIYNNPEDLSGEGTGEGNFSKELYLNTQAFGLASISIDDLNEYKKQIELNPVMDDALNGLKESSIAYALDDDAPNFDTLSKLKINPEINPKWYITSFEKITGENCEFNQAFLGSPLTLMFEAGNDNVKFRPSNIRIAMVRMKESSRGNYDTPVISYEKIPEMTESTEDVIFLRDYNEMSSDLTLTLTESIKLDNPLIKTPNRYRIMVFGHDGSGGIGEDFVELGKTWYGIKAVRSAQPPVITFLYINDSTLPREESWFGPNNKEIKFDFAVKTDSEDVLDDYPKVTVEVTNNDGALVTEENLSGKFKINKSEITPVRDGNSVTTYRWSLSGEDGKLPIPVSAGRYKVVINIDVEDTAGTSSSKTIKYQIDTEPPVVTMGIPSPLVSEKYLNGTASIPLSYSENESLAAEKGQYFEIIKIADGSVLTSGDIREKLDEAKKNFVLDTLSLPDNTEIRLDTVYTDHVGNITKTSSSPYTVNQESDKPVFVFSNLKKMSDAVSERSENSFGLKTGNMISGSISDDDGIKLIEVRVKGIDSAGNESAWSDWAKVSENTANLNYIFYAEAVEGVTPTGKISSDGKYKIQFRATDVVGLEKGKEIESEEFNILVDGQAPIFDDSATVVNAGINGNMTALEKDGNYYYVSEGKSVQLTVLIDEGNLSKVSVNGADLPAANIEQVSGEGNETKRKASYLWIPGDVTGEIELKFVAEDESRNTKEKSLLLYYDKAAPVLSDYEVSKFITANGKDNNVNGDITIKGTLSDGDKVVESNLSIYEADGVTPVTTEGVKTAGVNNSVMKIDYVIDTTKLTDHKSYYLVITAKDRSGNILEDRSKMIYVDQSTDKPLITPANFAEFASFEDIESQSNATRQNFFTQSSIISGAVSDDDGIGVIYVAYQKDGDTNWLPAATTEGEPAGKKFTGASFACGFGSDLGIVQDGKYKIKVTVRDNIRKAGADSETEKDYNVIIHGVAPVISDIKVTAAADSETEITNDRGTYYANNIAYLKFKLQEVYLDERDVTVGITGNPAGSVYGSVEGSISRVETTDIYNCIYTWKPGATVSGTSIEFTINAKDTSNNTALAKSVTVFFDKDGPEIEAPVITKFITTNERNDNVNGKITVKTTISDAVDKVNDQSTKLEIYESKGNGNHDTQGTAITTPDLTTTVTNTATNQTYTIDTTKLTDKKEYVLKFISKDRTGNESVKTEKFYVYQATDIPYVTFPTIDKAGDYSANVFGMGSWVINGNAEDDDGVSALAVYEKQKKYKQGTEYYKYESDSKLFTLVSAAEKNKPGVDPVEELDNDTDIDANNWYTKTPLTVENGGAFKYEIPHSPVVSGKKDIAFEIIDTNSTPKVGVEFVKFAVDNESPKFVSQTVGGQIYQEQMFADKDHTIVLNVSDDNEVKKVYTRKQTETEWSDDIASTNLDSTKTTVTHSLSDLADGDFKIEYKIEDLYGRTNEFALNYKIDSTAPVFDESKIQVTDGKTNIQKNDSDFANKWFTGNNITVRGEAGSVTEENFNSVGDVNITNTVNPDGKPGTFTMASSFETTMAGLPEGETGVTIVAKDKAGHSTPLTFTVHVDTTAPEVSALSLNGKTNSFITNNKNITVAFNTKDVTSGLEKAYISTSSDMSNATEIPVSSQSDKSVNTSVSESYVVDDVPSDSDSKNYTIYIQVKDVAGNLSEVKTAGTFVLDQKAPVVTYPAQPTYDNKLTSITVSVNELNGLDSANPKVYWKKTSDTDWNEVTTETNGSALTFSADKKTIGNIDTTKFNSTGTDVSVDMYVAFTDSAGNITPAPTTENGFAKLTFTVNQSNDRPVVTFDQVNINPSSPSTLSTKDILFTVEDDDGSQQTDLTVKYFAIPLDRSKNIVKNDTTWDSEGTKWKDFTWTDAVYENGKWKASVSGEGNYSIILNITDKSGTEFKVPASYAKVENSNPEVYVVSSSEPDATAILSVPKLKYRSDDISISNVALFFSVDTTPPTIIDNKVYLHISDEDKGELTNNTKLGGTKRPSGKIYIKATDTVTSFNDENFKAVLKGFGADINMSKTGSDEFYADGIDFTTLNGLKNISIQVTEPSGLTSEQIIRTVIIDNRAPGEDAISSQSPGSGQMVTGEVTYTGFVQDDKDVNTGVESIEYYIPKYSEKDTAPSAISSGWKTSNESNSDESIIMSASGQWRINKLPLSVVRGEGNVADTMHSDYSGYETSTGSGLFSIPIWFKITDVVGNVGYSKENRILYNPDGDRPRVNITYPVEDTVLNATTKYVVMGGNVIVSGNATDNEGVDAVWLQLDVNGDGVFNYTDDETTNPSDKKWLETACTDSANTGKTYADLLGIKVESFTNNSVTYYGIKADGTQSWQKIVKLGAKDGTNLLLNDLEIGKTGNSTNKCLAVRVLAVDSAELNSGTERGQLVSSWSTTLHISVNNSVPVFEDFILNQYNNAQRSTLIASQAYQEDKYISGSNWFLEGNITDNNGIKEIDVSGSVNSSGISKTSIPNGYSVSIPVSGNGSWGINIVAYDNDSNGSKESKMKYSLNIDNTAPTFTEGTVTSTDENNGDIKIHKGSISGNVLNAGDVKVQNSDGAFTIAGKIDESGSGFERVAFYVVRRGASSNNTVDRIYNVMKAVSEEKQRTNLETATLSGTTLTVGTTQNTGVYIDPTDNLPLKKVTGLTRNSELSMTLSAAPDANVRKGGLVKIGGVYRRITNISGNSIEFDSPCPVNYKEAYLVYATLSIDQTNDTKKNGIYLESDGDELVESYTKAGSTYTWDASIDSTNIPDGPLEIHFVVFDKAGNKSHGIVHTNVSNNAPRLAKIRLGTDLNKDKKISKNEIRVYDRYREENNLTDVADLSSEVALDTDGFTVKSGLAVIPEFVGGNLKSTEKMMMVLKRGVDGMSAGQQNFVAYNNKTGDSKVGDLEVSEFVASKYTGVMTEIYSPVATAGATDERSLKSSKTGNNRDRVDSIFRAFFLKDSDLFASGEKKNTAADASEKICLTFWDNTEETIQGQTSQNAVLYLKNMKYEMVDKVAPKVVIKPFKWVDKDDNSLYENKTTNGHIEVEGDLSNGTWGSDYTDGAPKVSGKIVFRGTAYDNVGLKKLTFSYGTTQNQINARYDSSTNTWAVYGGDNSMDSDHWHLEVYNEINATSPAAADVAKRKNFSSADAYFGQNGHKVAWEFAIDTEQFTRNVAALNQSLKVVAEDNSTDNNNGSNSSIETASTAAEEGTLTGVELDRVKNKSVYVVDVVPYITSVSTYLSGKDMSIKGSYSRTSTGKYTVRNNETAIKLYGFNLANVAADASAEVKATYYVADSQTTANTATVGAKASDTNGSYLPLTSISSLRSGNITVSVNGVKSINNVNNNNACGSYKTATRDISSESSYNDMITYAYNRMPNNISNNQLTDDVYFDIWEITPHAATAHGSLKYPVMHINPSNDQIGFGFANAGDSISFPTNDYSYRWFQKNNKDYNGTNFAYDSQGYAHTISVGLDAQMGTGVTGRMTYINSRWFENNDGSSKGVRHWDKRYSIALESVGIPNGVYIKGVLNNVTGDVGKITVDRFATPSIAVATHNNVPTVYTMYYDSYHQQIRFRYGTVNNATTARATTTGGNTTYTQYGLLNDSKSLAQVHSATNSGTANTGIETDTNESGNNYNNHRTFEASRDYYALVAGDYYYQSVFTGKDRSNRDTYSTDITIPNGKNAGDLAYSTGNNASEYYCLDVVPGNSVAADKVVMVWYDDVNQKLMYMYRTNIGIDNKADSDNRDASSAGVKSGNNVLWSVPKEIITGKLLQDCVIKVDPLGGIHIAVYEQTNADLIYAYMPSADSATVYTRTIDSYSQVGKKIAIDTAVINKTVNSTEKSYVVPYISYFSEGLSNLPKLAYLPNGIDKTSDATIKTTLTDGADLSSTLFSGTWEVSLVPTVSSTQNDNVNVGVWKTAGVRRASTVAPNGTSTAYDSSQSQKVYGNGITEYVVGYAIKDAGVGYIETAMKR
ncbi:MAG: hypothetical protein MJ182_04860 [Treponema sp.]|nr:hypothetical protein [Treponema sp.]